MRVLVAGAGGVIGTSLLRRLRDEHEVVGLTRTEEGAERVRELGAEAVVADALDREGLRRAVGQARPEVVCNQLTAIPRSLNPRRLDEQFELTNRLRTEGTRNLIDAGAEVGAVRHVAQSLAFAYAPGDEALKTESDGLNHQAPRAFAPTVAAIARLEEATLAVDGVVLRYGHLYGPGTTYAADGDTTERIRRRALPIIGRGRGLFSFVHVDDAAEATAQALGISGPLVLNVVDDDPAPSRAWITETARLVGAKPPRSVPAPLALLVAGPWAVEYMDRLAGASNARAREVLRWRPQYASWRQGFERELGQNG